MELTDMTFATIIAALKKAYLNWELPEESVEMWKNIMAVSVSEELLPVIIMDWVSNKTAPPKNPAEIIKLASKMVAEEWDSADASAEILIDSARNAYYASDDFLTFADEYDNSFASAFGMPAQEAYIKENIRTHSSNPKILILVYDELKGEVEDCFKGDAEHGVEFLRNHIKNRWNTKVDEAAKEFLKSGNSDFKRITGSSYGMLEG